VVWVYLTRFTVLYVLPPAHQWLVSHVSNNPLRPDTQKRIKQYLHPEYYYGHEEQDWHELYRHVDHCLEALRQQLLCSADVNVYTLKWTPHSKTKPSIVIPQQNACVNWEVLHGWMLGRAAGYNDLVKPV